MPFFRSNRVATIPKGEEAQPITEPSSPKVPNPMAPRTIFLSFPDACFLYKEMFTTCDEIYDLVQARLDIHLAKHNSKFGRTHRVSFYVTYKGKPLTRRAVSLQEYGIKHRDTLLVHTDLLLGGSDEGDIFPPLYTHVSECEKQVLNSAIQIQSVDDYIPKMLYDGVMSKIFEASGIEFMGKLLEDVGLLTYHITQARSKADYTVALITFVKLRSDGPLFCSKTLNLLTDKFHTLFSELKVQSEDDVFSQMRGYLDAYESVREAPIFQKLYKFAMYALSLSLFDKVGITFDTFRYSKIEQEALRRQYHMGPDFVHTLLDTVLFLCERGSQCMKTGDLDPIYHSGSTYEKWFNQAKDLEMKAQCLSYPEAHGFDRFSFLADLRDVIDQGQAIAKHAVKLGNYEKKLVQSVLSKLQLILMNETTKREAMKERKAPFSLLLYGGSSIGKSTLTKMLFYQYGKVHNLPTSSEYCYTRNPVDQYWSGFNSSQWCVIMDDMAFRHPGKASDGDSSVMEMIQVVNNVPFIPTQADLADKGRTPMRARLVIGSTNCEDLNAYHYYQTPLAARRRMPYIIDVQPKPEYTKDECMLDSSKVEQIDGEWPDYWIFRVKRVVPGSLARERQQAKTEDVGVFTDVNDFLAWYGKQSIIHENVQNTVNRCDENMSKIELCKGCLRNENVCNCNSPVEVQAVDDMDPNPTFGDYIRYILVTFILWCVDKTWIAQFIRMLLRTRAVRNSVENTFVGDADKTRFMRAQFHDMGDRVENRMGNFSTLIKIAKTITKYYALYKVGTAIYNHIRGERPTYDVQGNNLSTEIGTKPTAQDEKPNPWMKDDFQLTSFEVTPKITSWKSLQFEQVRDQLAKNLVHFRSFKIGDEQGRSRVIRAVAITGHIFMCNNHGIPHDWEHTEVVITSSLKDTGVNANMRLRLTESDVFRIPNKDICFVRIRNLPPRKDIMQLFARSDVKGVMSGNYLGRREDGTLFERAVEAIRYQKSFQFAEPTVGFDYKASAYSANVYTPTEVGDCGSLLIAHTGMGPIILGAHFGGNGNQVMASCITQVDVQQALTHFDEPQIQCGTPLLSAPSAQRELSDLAIKAPIRYFPEGYANVYGSFKGHRANHKSNVGPTYICGAITKRGVDIAHGAPVMKGWQPWHIALKDMIHPVTKLDGDILNHCVESYYNDIVQLLTKEDWNDIMVYDDVTTLNGAPGVAFVDKINRSTSAGNPWKKTKKAFLRPIPAVDGLQEPVEFTEEIMERVQHIIGTYHNGERYMPNFCGHLKDEATKFAKIEKKKTRVFTGAPADWSFVVRKYLLSVIRVMQNNRYVFEGAPGTNAASREWENIRSYLTRFGEDRMVAGDYASFDKSMPPTIILAAFDIIRKLCKEAGYTPEDLKVVQGIAEDTAFPLVDMNGDLIEFFGSNPSGHPLTVIVNGLANALYMRYCYAVLNPAKTATTFKKHVALMTYGDDNIMGVSREAPWFNHTTVQNTLASVGITYTMADKETESIPYINLSECSFLKRTWRWDEDVQAYLAPLEEASINKSLTTCVQSKTISAQAQAISIIASAVGEYFFYGKDVFEEKSAMLKEVVKECKLDFYVEESTFPTWEQLNMRFQTAVPRA
jgi:hypothetical protein